MLSGGENPAAVPGRFRGILSSLEHIIAGLMCHPESFSRGLYRCPNGPPISPRALAEERHAGYIGKLEPTPIWCISLGGSQTPETRLRVLEGPMGAIKTYKIFRYETQVRWESGRSGEMCSAGKPDLKISSPPEFKGEPGFWTPEDLFVASVNACTMTTFLAYAQHKNLQLVGYASEAEGVLENVDGKYRFTTITLHPHVAVKSEEAIPQARAILEDAHKGCLITNSTTAEVKLFPQFHVSSATSTSSVGG